MKIILFGKQGQLGWELQRSLLPLGNVIALGREDSPSANFLHPSEVASTVRMLRPDLIVNAAAYTAVDKAETDVDTAMAVNATTPGMLAQAAIDVNAWLVHFSTDYVFDGSGNRPWKEDDKIHPLNVYGASKALGEDRVRASGCKHLIFRTSWVYATRGSNFATKMIQLSQERNVLKVISDQFGAPTGADLLADVTAHACRIATSRPHLAGTYHLTANGETSWHNYARYVIRQARERGLPVRVSDGDILAVTTDEFPTPARRPANSRLDTNKLRQTFGVHLPDWQIGVNRMLDELLQKLE